MSPLNHEHCHLLFDDKKVIGHIAVKERCLSYKGIKTKVALIGAIALDQKYQQQGNFTPFFQDIISKYEKENSLLLLWSDLKPLYNRFNFFEAGGVIQTGKRALLNENLPKGWDRTTFNKVTKNEFNEIKELYKNQNILTIDRNNSDWDQIKEVTSSSLYTKKENDKIISYFVKDKGNDLPGIIHEFVCKDNSLETAFEELTDFQLWIPESYNSIFNKKDIYYAAFFRIGNLQNFSSFLNEITNHQLSLISNNESVIKVKYKDAQLDFKVEEFLTGIFGPNPIQEFSEVMPSLYIAGLDSI
jgi:hypothetical protein